MEERRIELPEGTKIFLLMEGSDLTEMDKEAIEDVCDFESLEQNTTHTTPL